MTVGRHGGAKIPAAGRHGGDPLRCRTWASCCRKGRWPVSSRFFVFLIPLVVIAVFWADGALRSEGWRTIRPTRASSSATARCWASSSSCSSPSGRCSWSCCPISTWWSESFHPKLPPAEARRAEGRPDHRAIQVLLRRAHRRRLEHQPHVGLRLLHHRLGRRHGAQLRHLLSAGLLHGAGRHRRRRCACSCWP